MSAINCPDCGKLISTTFPMHQCKPKGGYRNDLHRLMCQPASFFKAKAKRCVKSSWKTGDIFFMPANPGKLWRVRRVKGRAVWYLGNQYGGNPPRGILQKSCDGQTEAWVKVERKSSRS